MFMMRMLDVENSTENKTSPYYDKTLLETPEFKAGQAILQSVTDDKLPEKRKRILNSPKGCYLLGHQPPLITIEQAAKLNTEIYLQTVVSLDGVKALKEKLITMEQILGVSCLFNLQALLSKYGVKALEEKLITPEQAHKINFFNLQAILTHNGLIAIREGLITPKQLIENDKWGSSFHVYYLTHPEGIQAMRDKTMTYEKAQDMRDYELREKLGIPDPFRRNKEEVVEQRGHVPR